jgi:hypothetical protein
LLVFLKADYPTDDAVPKIAERGSVGKERGHSYDIDGGKGHDDKDAQCDKGFCFGYLRLYNIIFLCNMSIV